MIEIALIRHGKTAGNLLGRYIGTTDEPLCPEGVQALKGLDCPKAEIVYVSPMKRCLETAKILYKETPLQIVENFRECAFGEFENKNYKELAGNSSYQAWIDSGGTLPFPAGESTEDFKERTRRAFLEMLEDVWDKKYAHIAMVVHGGTIMSILEQWGKPSGDFYHWQVKNGRGFCVKTDQDTWNQEKSLFVTKQL